MHSLVPSQNKGLIKLQRRASPLQTRPSPPRGREAGCDSQSQKARGCCNLRPIDGIFHQTVNRIPAANHVFLRSRMVDIHQESHSLRSALQRRHMAHLRGRSHGSPRKLSSWDQGGDKTHHPPGTVRSPRIWLPELLGPGKGTKHTSNRVCAFMKYPRT